MTSPSSRQQRRQQERQRQKKPSAFSSTPHLKQAIDKLVAERGDHCSLCGQHLTHGGRTFYGTVGGVVKLTGNCCSSKLDSIVAMGLYVAKQSGYDFIIHSSDAPPQGYSVNEIERSITLMQQKIDQEDRRQVH